MVLQALPKPHADLPKVPVAINGQDRGSARIDQVGIHNVTAISRPFILLPARRRNVCSFCAKRFTATMNDQNFALTPKSQP